jgi:predicted AAA+ superfamily ATPase
MTSSFPRTVDRELDEWGSSDGRKPLVLRGARQVGKTHSIRALAARHGFDLVEIIFERRPDLKAAFKGDLSPSRIIPELELLTRSDIDKTKSILFFDEIQHCPAAIQALRFFYEDTPSLRVVSAGSLLELAHEKTPFPVGRVSFLWMFPLSFRKFLSALGHHKLTTHLPVFPSNKGTVPHSAQDQLTELLKLYLLVGGMPEAVRQYPDRQSMSAVIKVHEELAASYLDDIRKHARGDIQVENTRNVLSNIFGFAGKQVNYTLLGEGDEIKRTKRSIDILCQALLIHRVRCVSPAEIPFGAHSHEKYFKILFLDVGLGQFLAGVNASEILRSKNLNTVFDRRLTKQFVGQELIANASPGGNKHNLYYWARMAKSSAAELDYVLAREGRIIGVEVKSGKGGRLKSLHHFLTENIGDGLVLQDTNEVTTQGSLHFWPLFTKVIQ